MEGKLGVGGVSAEEDASGEGEGVVAFDLNNSGGIDSKGLGGPDGDMVRTRTRTRGESLAGLL